MVGRPQGARTRALDRLVYAQASRDGFDALVTCDNAQADHTLEMRVLSRVVCFSVVT